MKKLLATLFFGLMFFGLAAQNSDLPNITLKNLDGQSVNIAELNNDGKPFVITFWATWCGPCVKEHNALTDVYDDWVEETGVKLYAVSIDDSKTASQVAPFVNGHSWDYVVLQDINSDFKRAMNVVNVPYLCILNGNGEIVWQHTSYAPGGENEVYEELLKWKKK